MENNSEIIKELKEIKKEIILIPFDSYSSMVDRRRIQQIIDIHISELKNR